MDLEERIKSAIRLYNDGSDNVEYLRGQLELAEFLLGKPLDMGMNIECPNHGGSFDCTPFCVLCEGEQEVENV